MATVSIPDGYEFVRDGKVKEGEYFIATKTREVLRAKQDFDYVVVTIVRPRLGVCMSTGTKGASKC